MANFDYAVIGAGAFGAWTAWHLHQRGRKVVLVDCYGPANTRASSSDESRIIRHGYGPKAIYTRMTQRAFAIYRETILRADPSLYHETGCLWLAPPADPWLAATQETLAGCGVTFDLLDADTLAGRYPQMRFPEPYIGLLEPDAGVLTARRLVQTLVRQLEAAGVPCLRQEIHPDRPAVSAGAYLYCCGPWLPRLFPRFVGTRIRPSRQEVFYLGPPPGDAAFASPSMPVWLDVPTGMYGLPDIEGRGFKISSDEHGETVNPDTLNRGGAEELPRVLRAYVNRHFPALANAPLLESRVCQYENTASADYLIDRHPERPDIWLIGGGSGHGFKHGPAVGEYVAQLIEGERSAEPAFLLESKQPVPGSDAGYTHFRAAEQL